MRRLRPLTLALAAAVLATAPARAAVPAPLYGVTLDKVKPLKQIVPALQALPVKPTVRVYFDTHEPASYYAPALAQIHPAGYVMGELLDSSDEKAISVTAMQERVRSYLQALAPDVDLWEIGNEVNGNWTGPYETVAAKLVSTYEQVAAAGATTALTLYANSFGPDHCGDGESELTPLQFTRAYVPANVADGLDYVLLSYYPTQCGGREPSATEVALELEQLHLLYPNAQLGFGEVGLPRRASKKKVGEAQQIMDWAYSLSPGLPYSAGGYFWWYAAEDALRDKAPLTSALREAFEDEAAALG